VDDIHGENKIMIPVDTIPEPPHFDSLVRIPGNDWLRANPVSEKFDDLWKHVRKDLADGFHDLCGYSAIFTKPGTVDHYIAKDSPHGRSLAYEWSNYRFASSLMNTRKGTWNRRILDPFEVGHGWFEILLPNLEMVVVDELIPIERRDDAHFTLKTLRLRDDVDVLENRRHWYEQFTKGDLTLNGLAQHAPLIARAVRKRLDEINVAALEEGQAWFHEFVEGIHTLSTLRRCIPHLEEEINGRLSRIDSRIRRRS
jgi:hypothetical protein